VRLGLPHLLKAQTLIQPIRPVILQRDRKYHPLTLFMGSGNRIPQNSAANPLVLMIRFDLNLANFYSIGGFQELNHAYPYASDFDAKNAAAFPTFSTMSKVPALVPMTPRCEE
jgi:hypothetical protein